MKVRDWLAAACAAALGWNGAAQAAPGDDLVAADNALKAKVDAAATAGNSPPTLADDAAEVRSAYSVEALAAEPADLGGIMNACSAGYGVLGSYLTFGGGDAGMTNPSLVGRNELRFQDEIAIGFRFEMACFARAAPLMQTFVAQLKPSDWTATRRDGLARIRKGLTDTFAGLITLAHDPIRLENRETILGAAATAAPALVSLMPLSQRQALGDRVDQALAGPGLSAALRADLQAIRTALSSTDCAGACAI